MLASLALILAMASATSPVEVKHGAVRDHEDWLYWELAVDLKQAELVVFEKAGGAFLQDMLPKGAVAAINGGYFMPDYKPTGWVRDAKREVSKRRQTKRGGIVAVKGEQVYVGPQASVPFTPELAIHNSPLLIENDGKGGKIGMRSDDGRPAARTVVCLRDATLRFVVIQPDPKKAGARGPTLMQTAELMKELPEKGGFGCVAALNLDGGPSTGVWLDPVSKVPSSPPLVPIGYGIAIKAR